MTCRFAWNLNDTLDQLETFFRDVKSSFEQVSRGHYFRRSLPGGLHGEMRDSVELINRSLGALAENTKTATDEIRNVVTSFQRDTGVRQSSSDSMLEMANSVQSSMEQMRASFRGIAENAQRTFTSVEFAHDICYASLVKVDHIIYKQKAYKAFRPVSRYKRRRMSWWIKPVVV